MSNLFHYLYHFTVVSATKAGSSSSSPGPSSSPAKASQGSTLSAQLCDPQHKDCLLREFRKLCAMVAENNSYNVKTQIIEKFLRKGSGGGWCVLSLLFCSLWSWGCDRIKARISTPKCLFEIFFPLILDKFHGDLYLTVKLLLPGVVKSVYNLNDKQIVKLFSRIFRCNQDDMVRDLEQVCDPCSHAGTLTLYKSIPQKRIF